MAHAAHVPIWFEPVSVVKAARATEVLSCLTYTSPNAQELIAMAAAIDPVHNTQAAHKLQLDLAAGSHESAAAQLHLLAPFVLSVLKVADPDLLLHASLHCLHLAKQLTQTQHPLLYSLSWRIGFQGRKAVPCALLGRLLCTLRLDQSHFMLPEDLPSCRNKFGGR